MKLVELLAKELAEWPNDACVGVQDADGDNTIWSLPNGNCNIEFNGYEWKSSGQRFEILISQPSCRADDYKTSIVTHAQWQAERDRQKGGEWKRHRAGRNQPVPDRTKVEVKFRDGEIHTVMSDRVDWIHYGHGSDLMQYRIISQPQAEEVEVNTAFSEHVESANNIKVSVNESGKFVIDQIDGPIKWRDTIIHCQAIIEDCEREIQRNVDLLDAEGLMMQKDSKKAMQHYVPVTIPYTEWQDGDIVRCVDKELSCADLTIGKEYTVVTRHGEVGVIDDEEDHMTNCIECGELEFVRRP